MMNYCQLPVSCMTEQFKSKYLTLWMEEGILCGRYASKLHLTLDIARACVESRIFFSRGKSYPLLIDMKGIKSTTREARSYLATMGVTLVNAGALITGSSFNRMLGNIFLKIDKPPVPMKLFTSEEKAKEWLQQFIEEPQTAVAVG